MLGAWPVPRYPARHPDAIAETDDDEHHDAGEQDSGVKPSQGGQRDPDRPADDQRTTEETAAPDERRHRNHASIVTNGATAAGLITSFRFRVAAVAATTTSRPC